MVDDLQPRFGPCELAAADMRLNKCRTIANSTPPASPARRVAVQAQQLPRVRAFDTIQCLRRKKNIMLGTQSEAQKLRHQRKRGSRCELPRRTCGACALEPGSGCGPWDSALWHARDMGFWGAACMGGLDVRPRLARPLGAASMALQARRLRARRACATLGTERRSPLQRRTDRHGGDTRWRSC